MGRGLPKKYAKMGFKKGWKAYKASKRGKTSSSKKKSGNPNSKGGRSLVRGFSYRTFIPILKTVAFGAPAYYTWTRTGGGPEQKVNAVIEIYTGFNMSTGSFDFSKLSTGWMPLLTTSLVTAGISKLMGMIRRV